MVEQVAGILVKLGLTRASCRFPDWQTLDHLVQLVQLPDASAAHSVYPAHASGRLRAPGARPRRGRAFHIGGRSPDRAARARHVRRAHARGDVQGYRHRHPADPGRPAAHHRRARRQRRAAGAGGDGPRRQVHPAHQLPGPADADLADPARRRAAERHPAHRPAVLRGAALRRRPGLPARGAAGDRPAAEGPSTVIPEFAHANIRDSQPAHCARARVPDIR